LGRGVVESALLQLEEAGRVVRGDFCRRARARVVDKNVLRQIKQRSLAKLRRAIEPAPPEAFRAPALAWQGAAEPSRSPDALERAIDQLQGTPSRLRCWSRRLPAPSAAFLQQIWTVCWQLAS